MPSFDTPVTEATNELPRELLAGYFRDSAVIDMDYGTYRTLGAIAGQPMAGLDQWRKDAERHMYERWFGRDGWALTWNERPA